MQTSRQQIFFLFSAFLTAVTLVWASDVPWKGKPYPQWDDADLTRVFSDSPWARSTTISRAWLPLTSKDLPNETLSGRDRGLPATLDRAAETSNGGELIVHVFWASSRVVRAASARKAILHGGQNVDVEKYVSEPQEEYQVVLQSEDMAPFVRHDEKFYETNAFLQMRKSKLKLSPSHVHYEHDSKGVLVTSAIFYFPKKTASGDPTVAADEKSVEFNCKLEGSSLRVSFEPQKMVDQNGPAL
jgi:hypothetical protein